jgi:hypothetical protein
MFLKLYIVSDIFGLYQFTNSSSQHDLRGRISCRDLSSPCAHTKRYRAQPRDCIDTSDRDGLLAVDNKHLGTKASLSFELALRLDNISDNGLISLISLFLYLHP